MSGSWLESMPFGSPTYITHKVCGQEMQFYPISVGKMLQLRTLAKPLASALSVLFEDTSKDTGATHKDHRVQEAAASKPKGQEPEDAPLLIHDTQTESTAIDPRLAELRLSKRSEAMATLTEALTSESTLHAVADLIMDSLRLEIKPPAREFVNHATLEAMSAMIHGVIKANKGVLGPLEGKALGLSSRAGEAIKRRVNEVAGSDQGANEASQ